MEGFLKLAARIMDVGTDEISLGTTYKEFAPWDSITFLRLVMELEEEYGLDIPMERFGDFMTLGDFFGLIES
jgi:acyl carrier protein